MSAKETREFLHTPETSKLNDYLTAIKQADGAGDYFEGLCIGKFSSLHLEYNECHTSYQSVLDAVSDPYSDEYRQDWINIEDQVKACENDSMWTLHCYKHTPVAHFRIRASTLGMFIAYIERD